MMTDQESRFQALLHPVRTSQRLLGAVERVAYSPLLLRDLEYLNG